MKRLTCVKDARVQLKVLGVVNVSAIDIYHSIPVEEGGFTWRVRRHGLPAHRLAYGTRKQGARDELFVDGRT
jgi:hypothetical protein